MAMIINLRRTRIQLPGRSDWYNKILSTRQTKQNQCRFSSFLLGHNNSVASCSAFSTSSTDDITSSSSKVETPIKIPTTKAQSKTWERSAKLVQNTNIQTQYLEKIRQVHDPNQHVKTLEDELMGAMAEALRKQSNKIYFEYNIMKEQLEIYLDKSSSLKRRQEARIIFNERCVAAKRAKWELIVHRQAIGFRIKNHDTVNDMFPIPPPLPEIDIDEIEFINEEQIEENNNLRSSDKRCNNMNLYERFIHAFRS